VILPDVNVLVYAHRKDAPDHERYRDWLESTINSSVAYGLSDLVVSGFLRIVTHPRVFKSPSKWADALTFAEQLRNQPHRVAITPGGHHWEIFARLCQQTNAKGNLVPDAYLAAMAIESGCEWITTDHDFGRFPGLKWSHPLRDLS
jgi:toxin-antitoxin system PIN domain toxin